MVSYTNPIQGTVTQTLYTNSSGNWNLTGLLTSSNYTVSLDMSFGPANGYKVTTNNVTYTGNVTYGETKHVGDQ